MYLDFGERCLLEFRLSLRLLALLDEHILNINAFICRTAKGKCIIIASTLIIVLYRTRYQINTTEIKYMEPDRLCYRSWKRNVRNHEE